MTGSVYKVEDIFLAVVFVIESASLQFDGDTALFFNLHIVEKLLGHITLGHRARFFNKTVGKRTLAVVDVRDYGKIAYVFFAQSVLSHQNFAISKNFDKIFKTIDFIIKEI